MRKDQKHPTPIVAAITHLWFESIHPFSDGNGRIGRAIIEHVFAKTKALPFFWLYFRFRLSLRLAEVLLLERGIVVSYKTIRCWGQEIRT